MKKETQKKIKQLENAILKINAKLTTAKGFERQELIEDREEYRAKLAKLTNNQ